MATQKKSTKQKPTKRVGQSKKAPQKASIGRMRLKTILVPRVLIPGIAILLLATVGAYLQFRGNAYTPTASMIDTRDSLLNCRGANVVVTVQKKRPAKNTALSNCTYAVENLLNYYDQTNPGYQVDINGWYRSAEAQAVSGYKLNRMNISGSTVVDVATYDNMVLYMNDRITAAATASSSTGTDTSTSTSTDSSTPSTPVSTKPDATNTGVPSGHALAVPVTNTTTGISVASNGNVTISKAGTFENMLIKGRLTIKADGVTIRYSRVEANPSPYDLPNDPTSATECSTMGSIANQQAITSYGRSNILIEDSEIIAVHPSTYLGNGIHGSGYTLKRVEIAGTVDGAGAFGTSGAAANVVIQDSYIHDLYVGAYDYGHSCGPSHSDGVQIHYGSNFTLTNNTISPNSVTAQKSNAAIMVNENGSYKTSNVTITGNWLDYGGCSLNIARASNSTGITGLKANNNSFGKNQSVLVGGIPCAIVADNLTKALAGNEILGNIWEDGSLPVPKVNSAGW